MKQSSGMARKLILLVLSASVAVAYDPIPKAYQNSSGTLVTWVPSHGGDYPSIKPPELTGVVQVAAGIHSLALKSDGTVVGWGYYPRVPDGLTGVVQVAAGHNHSLALKSDGTVVGFGENSHRQANVPSVLTGVVQVAAGLVHSLALKSDGTVVGWGAYPRNSYLNDGQADVPPRLKNVVQVAAGAFHSVALKSDGTVVAWGSSTYGKLAVPSGLRDVVQVAAGGYHTLALKRDGTVVQWGGEDDTNHVKALPELTNVVQVAAGGIFSVAVKSDGTVVVWYIYSGQVSAPPGLTGVVQVAVGEYHIVAMIRAPTPTPVPTPIPSTPTPAPTPQPTPTASASPLGMTSPATTRRSNYALKLDSSEDTSQVRYRIKPPGSRKFGRWTARGMRRGENDDWSARLKLPTRGRWQIQVQTFDANGNPGETRIMVVRRR